MVDIRFLEKKAVEARKRLIELIYAAGGGHTGGSLSSVDILVALHYRLMQIRPAEPKWPERDRFILSKGHSVEGYYCVLADMGFFSEAVLGTYGQPGSILLGHPTVKVPGVELNTGALGHGLGAGVGMALAAHMDNLPFRVFVLMGDGELAEGSVWEAAMAASHYKLANLTAIIDRNSLQISGNTEEIMALEDLSDRWTAFGWDVTEIDGHDMTSIVATVDVRENGTSPRLIVARTTKGKGISFIEDQPAWHHKVPTRAELAAALDELDRKLAELDI